MRFIYTDNSSEQEALERRKVERKIDCWWKEFSQNTPHVNAYFGGTKEWKLPDWMQRNLQDIDSELMWEFGPAIKTKGHRLVITCEASHHLRPLVARILADAPTITGWEFYPFRLPETLDQATAAIKGRTGYTPENVTCLVKTGKFNRIDLEFCFSRTNMEMKKCGNIAFVATETLLGEEMLDHWIGRIDVSTVKSEGVALDRLKSTVDSLINTIQERLPSEPNFKLVEVAKWVLIEMKPQEKDDYAQQDDMFLGKSTNEELWRNAHNGLSFSSRRFSRTNETFCYLKIDGSEGLDEERFADKGEIEDAVDAVLKPGLGCHIGGGTGLKYSYIDLALTDVPRATKVLRDVLREGRIPKRSWLLFFDADMEHEWIGIWDDTPSPPMQKD